MSGGLQHVGKVDGQPNRGGVEGGMLDADIPVAYYDASNKADRWLIEMEEGETVREPTLTFGDNRAAILHGVCSDCGESRGPQLIGCAEPVQKKSNAPAEAGEKDRRGRIEEPGME
eukprot:TRINITY_DN890_c0_g1_i2.p5 TRINITY_DN890_c0_g1~~TRINITY_DN890_c0_g1_i2.p5  ORF type:complete len:116 (+),score=14.80 TRINITY_DN890_c0_g1_i2:768-1115(+)